MWLPMAILAIGSVSSGFLLSRGNALVNWLAPLFAEHAEKADVLKPVVVTSLALLMVAIGVVIAFMKYSRGEVSSVAPEDVSLITKIVRRDLLQDDFNEAVFMRTGQGITNTLVKTEELVIDGLVRGVGSATLGSASTLRRSQTGFVRSYAAWILLGAVVLIAAIWLVTQ